LQFIANRFQDFLLDRTKNNINPILDEAYRCLDGVQVGENGGCRASYRADNLKCGSLRQASVMKLFTRLRLPLHHFLRPDALSVEVTLARAKEVITELRQQLRADLLAMCHPQLCCGEFDSLYMTYAGLVSCRVHGVEPLGGDIVAHFLPASKTKKEGVVAV
jgi:hypothetical protein